jgi:hypothetical protein
VGQGQETARLGVKRAAPEEIRERRRGDGQDDEQERHDEDQFDEREGLFV